MSEKNSTDLFLDITNEVCPLTFVKTKLMVERMAVGQALEVRLNAGEPLENVPRSLAELGHSILSLNAEDQEDLTGVHRLRVRKN
ncbi:sulfurtransferase TusA family protein [Azospirillum doebereinerae]|uniref:Sulfurtransferase TusA family protein n=1 Tax=Azospirillum doebereinerae TaxID=92933 RepID=A0A433J351_9PROT|nr:sulfurtransferase TusA family protein [Azospirillum doebereinerae]MCG5244100.1 sulfurtransferase TusA family protein [Azospirillum doebereinerae]RUQ66133.1 sulfurtransferase TusA family protein [Azospirillum doebereinerae]